MSKIQTLSWEDATGLLNAPDVPVEIHRLPDGRLCVSREMGAWISEDEGSTWKPFEKVDLWTRRPPAAPGEYWHRGERKPYIVRIEINDERTRDAFFIGHVMWEKAKDLGGWWWPFRIEAPPVPRKP